MAYEGSGMNNRGKLENLSIVKCILESLKFAYSHQTIMPVRRMNLCTVQNFTCTKMLNEQYNTESASYKSETLPQYLGFNAKLSLIWHCSKVIRD